MLTGLIAAPAARGADVPRLTGTAESTVLEERFGADGERVRLEISRVETDAGAPLVLARIGSADCRSRVSEVTGAYPDFGRATVVDLDADGRDDPAIPLVNHFACGSFRHPAEPPP